MAEAANKQVFVIIALKNERAIANKIGELGVPFYGLKDDVWFAVYAGTTREFAETLRMPEGEIGVTGVVMPV